MPVVRKAHRNFTTTRERCADERRGVSRSGGGDAYVCQSPEKHIERAPQQARDALRRAARPERDPPPQYMETNKGEPVKMR
jgi:hypothetical protein